MGKEDDRTFAGDLLVSVIIPVFNDWEPLDQCLRSLEQQVGAPRFELIVVDDGSYSPSPPSVQRWSESHPLTLIRQPHEGVASARNRGLHASTGSVIVFVDADCRFQADCLAQLKSNIDRFPQHDCFQLRLTGDCSTLVGRAEELRLITLQNHMLRPDGRIHYLNTAGFAIRRARIDVQAGLFDPSAVRAEDTFLLARLIQEGELPLFVDNAVIQHVIPLSLVECLLKDFQSAFSEAKSYAVISSRGVRIRVSPRKRLSMIMSMWQVSAQPSIGRAAWFVLATRQGVRLVILFLSQVFQRVGSTFRRH